MKLQIFVICLLTIHISTRITAEATIESAIVITKLPAESPAFFRNVGKMFTYTGHWNIITYINLAKFQEEFIYLYNLKENIFDLCNNFTKSVIKNHCAKMDHEFNSTILRITKEQDIIEHYIGSTREKRSLFDGVGHVIKSLFGNLDDEDAKYYDQAIDFLQSQTSRANSIAKKQTSVLESTYNLLNTTIIQTENRFNDLRTEITTVQKQLECIWTQYNSAKAMYLTNELNELFTLQMANLQHQQDNLIQIILMSLSGKLHPYLIDPQTLENEIFKILPSLPADVFIAGTKQIFQINTLYQIAEMETKRINKKLIFRLGIPLLHITQLTMYELIVLPIPIKNDFFYILHPENNLVIIDVKNEYYAVEHLNLIQGCKLTEHYHICKQNFPLINSHSYQTCEFNLYNNGKMLNNCNKKVARIEDPLYIKIKNTNSWLYNVPTPEPLDVLCENEHFKLEITGKGIMELLKHCVINSRGVKLYANIDKNFTLASNYFTSSSVLNHSGNEIFEFTANSAMPKNKIKSNQIQIIKENQHLLDLGKKLEELKETEKQSDTDYRSIVAHHTHHHFSIIYFLIILIAIVIIGKIVFRYKNCIRQMGTTKQLPRDPQNESRISNVIIDSTDSTANNNNNNNDNGVPRYNFE